MNPAIIKHLDGTEAPLTVAVDFDGVLHSFTSGWRGTTTIADPPSPGAIEWLSSLLAAECKVIIHTCRFNRPEEFPEDASFHDGCSTDDVLTAIAVWLGEHGMDPDLVGKLRWHTAHGKPHAHIYLDDRAVRFDGTFPGLAEMVEMQG